MTNPTGVPVQRSGVDSEAEWHPEHADGVRIFVDHAWNVMRWHRERADASDRLATHILAFAGILATLAGTVALANWQNVAAAYRPIVAWGLVAAPLTLLGACLTALSSLMGRVRRVRSSTEEVQDRWAAHRSGRRRAPVELLADLVQTLVGEPGDSKPAIIDLRNAARRRETRTRIAVVLLAISIVLICAVLVALLAFQQAGVGSA